MNEPNTIWIKAFTPQGRQVGITIGGIFEDGTLLPAREVDEMLTDAGYSLTMPGLEVGEKQAMISHVAIRNHIDAKTGEIIPVIAFYDIESGRFEHKRVHKYLNSSKDISEFEQASGLKLSSLPMIEGNTFPSRNDRGLMHKIMGTKQEFAVVWKHIPDEKEGGLGKNVFQRYLGVDFGKPETERSVHWSQTDLGKEQIPDMVNGLGIDKDQLRKAAKTINVTDSDSVTAYKQALKVAYNDLFPMAPEDDTSDETNAILNHNSDTQEPTPDTSQGTIATSWQMEMFQAIKGGEETDPFGGFPTFNSFVINKKVEKGMNPDKVLKLYQDTKGAQYNDNQIDRLMNYDGLKKMFDSAWKKLKNTDKGKFKTEDNFVAICFDLIDENVIDINTSTERIVFIMAKADYDVETAIRDHKEKIAS